MLDIGNLDFFPNAFSSDLTSFHDFNTIAEKRV